MIEKIVSKTSWNITPAAYANTFNERESHFVESYNIILYSFYTDAMVGLSWDVGMPCWPWWLLLTSKNDIIHSGGDAHDDDGCLNEAAVFIRIEESAFKIFICCLFYLLGLFRCCCWSVGTESYRACGGASTSSCLLGSAENRKFHVSICNND